MNFNHLKPFIAVLNPKWLLIIFFLLLFLESHAQQWLNESDYNDHFLKSKAVIIVAPHPDDEILGFAGIIYDAVKRGKRVQVVVVTNGDGYGSACFFRKNGFPKEDKENHGEPCSREDLELYGMTRIGESRKALKILGLDSANFKPLGYPDGWIGEMVRHPDSVYRGNTSRIHSFSGKAFRLKNLEDDLKDILQSDPDAEVYTTHFRDSHDDHSSVAAIIQRVRQELCLQKITFTVYWAVIHEPSGDNNAWPTPSVKEQFDVGKMMSERENRYAPWEVLWPPSSMVERAFIYFTPECFWDQNLDHSSLMRIALDQFETGIGLLKPDGAPVKKEYEGWMDRNGYFLSFVKRNHLFWPSPFPENCKNQLLSKNPQ
ncbi:MAG: PIG-L family deacetylase [Bacteroidota bacterium]